MAQRLAARPDILDRRREIVEHPFGSIKQWINQGAFLMRGVDNVLRRALNILGVETMMAAVTRTQASAGPEHKPRPASFSFATLGPRRTLGIGP